MVLNVSSLVSLIYSLDLLVRDKLVIYSLVRLAEVCWRHATDILHPLS